PVPAGSPRNRTHQACDGVPPAPPRVPRWAAADAPPSIFRKLRSIFTVVVRLPPPPPVPGLPGVPPVPPSPGSDFVPTLATSYSRLSVWKALVQQTFLNST